MMRASKIALAAVFAAALVALAAGFAWWGLSGDDGAHIPPQGTSPTGPGPVQPSDTPSPTTTEASSGTPTPTPTPSGLDAPATPGTVDEQGEVTVMITFADWDAAAGVLEVGAYAAVTGEAGTCTLTATQGTRSTQVAQPAVPDVSTMSCGGLTLPRAEMSSGEWSTVVAYESSKSRGTSDAVLVRIP